MLSAKCLFALSLLILGTFLVRPAFSQTPVCEIQSLSVLR